MSFDLSYSPPGSPEITRTVVSELFVGRDPSDPGLQLIPLDETISRNAVSLRVVSPAMEITNTSSFAEVEVLHDRGSRLLFPGEALTTSGKIEVVIRGEIFTHRVALSPKERRPEVSETAFTQPLQAMGYEIPPERLPTLVALCASRFEPGRFGSDLLSAASISSLLKDNGETVSPKAVNNKLQRIRDDIAETLGVYLESREDLADWAIRNGHVSRKLVEELISGS